MSNETNYDKPVDLKITCDLSDLFELNKELKKFGLQLIEKQKIVAMPVILVK